MGKELNIDAISHEQALVDVEVANARVVDLTERLTTMSREFAKTRTELELLKFRSDHERAEMRPAASAYVHSYGGAGELEHLRDVITQMRSSRLVRLASLFSSKLRKIL